MQTTELVRLDQQSRREGGIQVGMRCSLRSRGELAGAGGGTRKSPLRGLGATKRAQREESWVEGRRSRRRYHGSRRDDEEGDKESM